MPPKRRKLDPRPLWLLFRYLDTRDRMRCACTCKEWKREIEAPMLWTHDPTTLTYRGDGIHGPPSIPFSRLLWCQSDQYPGPCRMFPLTFRGIQHLVLRGVSLQDPHDAQEHDRWLDLIATMDSVRSIEFDQCYLSPWWVSYFASENKIQSLVIRSAPDSGRGVDNVVPWIWARIEQDPIYFHGLHTLKILCNPAYVLFNGLDYFPSLPSLHTVHQDVWWSTLAKFPGLRCLKAMHPTIWPELTTPRQALRLENLKTVDLRSHDLSPPWMGLHPDTLGQLTTVATRQCTNKPLLLPNCVEHIYHGEHAMPCMPKLRRSCILIDGLGTTSTLLPETHDLDQLIVCMHHEVDGSVLDSLYTRYMAMFRSQQPVARSYRQIRVICCIKAWGLLLIKVSARIWFLRKLNRLVRVLGRLTRCMDVRVYTQYGDLKDVTMPISRLLGSTLPRTPKRELGEVLCSVTREWLDRGFVREVLCDFLKVSSAICD